ncbi:nucleotide exchange factor GrpE [Bradyrhizobium brasilense]|uniref:nucleotide exchange factor GrpE n=1 Tax=Bradyrhizobium brasilense TaxID=1419277 RepID=UPI0024B1A482|nr:nucleotide exchange factor GrpE [Bradyrhizobium australafricanum]WFU34326.1 nucleotide exchange factor GrpE [Bradyrhizobium australafricanum]
MATKPMDADLDRAQANSGEMPVNNVETRSGDLEVENECLRERLMRALAESENTRRQGERRTEEAQRYAIASFARELLQVVDNLRRAISAGTNRADTGQHDPLIEGVTATDRILTEVLKRFGVEEIKALDAPFDPEKHEAVLEVDAVGQPSRNVVQVLENGYTLHDRLLRPARVAVAKAQRPSPQATRQ